MQTLNIMTCGSIDDGKSTLLGRLLHETNNIYIDQSQQLLKLSEKFNNNNLEVDYAQVLDGLIDEKEQGITIDIAFKTFTLKNRQFVLIDSPGHEEFTRNMANAATYADIALVLIDISNGFTNQTKKHIQIVNLFPNIKKVFFCINKIDLVDYSKQKIEEQNLHLNQYLESIEFKKEYISIPISALNGDNILTNSNKTKFYKKGSLLDLLTKETYTQNKNLSNYASVQIIRRESNDRYYYLKNYGLNIKNNDVLQNTTTGKEFTVNKVYTAQKNLKSTNKLNNLVITAKEKISINKNDVLVSKNENYKKVNSFKASIVCSSILGLKRNKRYLFKFNQTSVYGFISQVDIKEINMNSIATIKVELESKIVLDDYSHNYSMSQFSIISTDKFETLGFGFVTLIPDKGFTVHFEKINEISMAQKCIWFTGFSGSGKTTIAKNLQKKLSENGFKSFILDGDNMRTTINQDLGFTEEDRLENNRRIAHVANILFQNDIIPIVSTISPTKASREVAKHIFGENLFMIHLNTPIETCIKRNPKKLYNNKNKGNKNITGIDMGYEIPEYPNLTIDTSKVSINNATNQIINELKLSK
jgi:bifunctional enzyme CysN/CysC